MGARLTVLYYHPPDPGAFEAHYRDVHTPIVRRYPNLRGIRLTRLEGVAGRTPAFYLMAEMMFDSRADLDAALASEAGIESARDMRSFATAGALLLVADDEAATDA